MQKLTKNMAIAASIATKTFQFHIIIHSNQNVSVSHYSVEIWKLSQQLASMYIHWVDIIKIKYIFLARNVIKTYFHAETN